MGKFFDDDLDLYLDCEPPAKKYVKVSNYPGEIVYEKCLRDGLTALEDVFLSEKEKLIMAYHAMRTLEELDFKNDSPVMKQFADDDIIRIFYKDMCDVVHGKSSISFRTRISPEEDAKYVLVALAREVLDKKTVKSIMQDVGVSFEEYGKRSALKNFIADCDWREEPIIKLRKKERKKLESLRKTYGHKAGLKKYLKLRD